MPVIIGVGGGATLTKIPQKIFWEGEGAGGRIRYAFAYLRNNLLVLQQKLYDARAAGSSDPWRGKGVGVLSNVYVMLENRHAPRHRRHVRRCAGLFGLRGR